MMRWWNDEWWDDETISDEVLRDLNDRLNYLRNLEKRKEEVINSIDEQGKLTDELMIAIGTAKTLAEVEDLYRPYKQNKRSIGWSCGLWKILWIVRNKWSKL